MAFAPPRLAAAFALALLASVPAAGLDPARAPTQYRLDTWTQDHGLPQSTVTALLQTRDGYLWLGTEEGLVRFDGVRFTVFDRSNAPELKSAFISNLAEDGQGGLWIGTYGGGVAHLAGGRLRPLPAPPELKLERIGALRVDRAGGLLIGASGSGLVRWRGDPASLSGRFEALTAAEGLAGDRVSDIAEAPDGSLWVSSYPGGLSHVRGRLVERVPLGGHPAAGLVRRLSLDREGRVLVATEGAGLLIVEHGRVVRTLTERDGLSSDRLRSLLADRDGNLWIGTDRGLDRWHQGRLATLRPADGLPGTTVLSLLEDREGSLWMGSATGGLSRIRDGKFLSLTRRDGLPGQSTRPVLEDQDGALWVGTEAGLARVFQGSARTWTVRDGLPGDDVFALLLARDGSLLVGTDRGLARLRGGRVAATVEMPAGGRIRTLLEDRAGRLWVGSSVGLFQLDGATLHPAPLPAPFPDTPVRALLEDRAGRLRIGFDGGGLVTVEGGRVERLTRREGLGSDRVFALHEDAEGVLWIGTSGGGLSRLAGGRLATFDRAHGLHDDVVFRILEDGEGRLWLSSNRGLSRVARRDLERFASGQARTVEGVVAYGAADGMPSPECNGGSPAGTRTRDGRLWFPTIRGLAGVDPRQIPLNTLAPPVVIEAVEADGSELPGAAAAPPGTLRLDVRYTALSLRAPERVRFRYRLQGLDPDWMEPGTRRVAYYTRVPAGQYVFQVMAANEDGVWSEPASRPLSVRPHWYQTASFQLFLGGTLVGLVLGGYRFRVRALTALQAELQARVAEATARLREEGAEADRQRAEADRQRERAEQASRAKSAFVAGMSHELRTPLTAVLGFAQLMERRPERDAEDREHLAIINRSGEHLLGLINSVLSLAKIEAGQATVEEAPFDLRALLGGVADMFRPRAAGLGLAFECTLDDALPQAVAGDAGKLRQILINLLGNAFKFTERGRVSLRARAEGERVHIEVEDTGPGLGAEEQEHLFEAFTQAEAGRRTGGGTGLGLSLSRDYARLMRGDLTVASAPGRGCRFLLEVVLPAHGGSAPSRAGRLRSVTRLAPGQAPPSVLVIDDSADERLLLGRLLRDVGYDVDEAQSAEDGLAAWARRRPDAVVMDLHLPGLDGLAATEAIRRAEAAGEPARPRRTVIVCISASALTGEREGVRGAGGDVFLPKPFRDTALLGALAEHLGVRHVEGEAGAPPPAARLDAAALAAQPPGWRERLRAALAGGQTEQLRALAEEAAPRDEALGQALRASVRAYRFDEIEEALDAAEARP